MKTKTHLLKSRLLKMSLITAIALGSLTATASAQVLVGWDIDGVTQTAGTPLSNASADNLASGVSVSNWALSSSAPPTIVNASNVFDADGWSQSTSLNTASSYLDFTITPQAGEELNITGLNFSSSKLGTGAPTTGAWGFSTDGGQTWTTYSMTLATSAYNSSTMPTISNFSDITSTGPVEIAFFAYGATNTNGLARVIEDVDGNTDLADGLIVNGTVTAAAVPEPSTWALIVTGFLALGYQYRRMKRRISWRPYNST